MTKEEFKSDIYCKQYWSTLVGLGRKVTPIVFENGMFTFSWSY